MHALGAGPALAILLAIAAPAIASELPCDEKTRSAPLPVHLTLPAHRWLRAEVLEDGFDWVALASNGKWRIASDSAPSRLATERLVLPGLLFHEVLLDVRSWDKSSHRKPALRWSCTRWDSTLLGGVELMLGGAWLSLSEQTGLSQMEVRRSREAAEQHFEKAIASSEVPAERATAWHSIGYLQTRGGLPVKAAVAFSQASAAWNQAKHRAAELAARFHSAQARLNSGNVQQAANDFDLITTSSDLRRWPFLQAWVENDRCLAQRELGNWMSAASCFSRLERMHERRGEGRERALAACNRVAALAGGRRWEQARSAVGSCVAEQFRFGGRGGEAQALHLRGWIRLQRGELRTAIKDLSGALTRFQSRGDGPMSWQVTSLLASAWILLDEEPRARALLRQGLDEFSLERDSGTHMRLLFELGRMQQWSRQKEARSTLTDARDGYARLGWTRMQRAADCELASAGWGVATEDCPLGLARTNLANGHFRPAFAIALQQIAENGSWSTRILWLELALDSISGAADAAILATSLRGLVDASDVLVGESELIRRSRSAVRLELAGAAAALYSKTRDDTLALLAQSLLRSAGPSMSSSRSLLYGMSSLHQSNDSESESKRQPSPLLKLQAGIAEISYLRFGNDAFWVVARGDKVSVFPAISDDAAQQLSARWKAAMDLPADRAEIRQLGNASAQSLLLDQLISPADRVWLLRLSGGVAELPWASLPRPGAKPMLRLGYAPLAESLALVAVSGAAHELAMTSPIRINDLAALNPSDLPEELLGARLETTALTQLGGAYSLPVRLLSPRDLAGESAHFSAQSLFLLSGHALADRQSGDSAVLRVGANAATNWSLDDIESLTRPPGILILGACESAAGPARRYFGDFGLASAASRSGAQWVLGHRWPIDDQAAATLHQIFIRALLTGVPVPQALAVAQRQLMDSPRFAHPRFWAGAMLLHTGRSR